MVKGQSPKGHKKILPRFIFDVKHDSRHKSILVAGGNLTDVLLYRTHSVVVSLRVIRLVLFLSKLNGLKSWEVDIGNVFLGAFAKYEVCIVASPEFRPLEGHNLIIAKALCGLRTSGMR